MVILTELLPGISIGIELSSAIFSLMLFFIMKFNSERTKEMTWLKVFSFIWAISAWADLMSYLLEGNIEARNFVILMNLLSFIFTALSSCAFLRFLICHYDTKRKYCYPSYGWNLFKIFTVVVVLFYISSVWNGLLFSVSENSEYVLGPAAYVLVIVHIPFLVGVSYVTIQNRKLAENLETMVLLSFVGIMLVFGTFDVLMDTAFRYLAMSVFIVAVYFVVEVMQENERLQRQEAQKNAKVIEEANKSKLAFFGNISHDIKTPLTNISGFAALAKNNINDSEKVSLYLERITESNEILISLVNDIMEMNYIETGAIELEELPVNIHDNIHFLEMMISGDLTAKEQELVVNSDKLSQEIIYTDKIRLNQVLMNLLDNAIKYSENGQKIEFSVTEIEKPDPKTVVYEFKIKDNGIGMSRLEKNNIFNSYEKNKNLITNVSSGNGLGMAITKRIIDLMNGTIEIESELGQGTIVCVTIPFRIESEESKEKSDSNKESGANSIIGKKLLLVEDNELNREIATEMLEEEGLIIDSADDGDVAVDKMKTASEDTYDLILMDIQMPRLNGLDATKQIRGLDNPWARKIPIIAMSANAYKEDVEKSHEAGMDAHIAKPLDIDALLDVIDEFI